MKKASFSAADRALVASMIPLWKKELLGNCAEFRQYPKSPLLLAGAQYPGIWLEHNQDNLFLVEYAPEIAWASQEAFMDFQREDGLMPFALPVKYYDPKNFFAGYESCYWHLQSIYPFARCAFEIALKTGQPRSAFERIYKCGEAYDNWYSKYRDHKNCGLAEMFCEYDTGHDNSRRVKDDGIPGSCPEKDSVNMPDLDIMPVLSVDLSAMRYGARIALAEIAEYLGKNDEAAIWRAKAEETRLSIKKYLYDEESCFYYDRDTRGFRKYRTEHITRLFLNKVLTQEEFDAVYERYFCTPGKEFCPEYPIPSVSIDDPSFDHSCPNNSWGCNSQALTAIRAILWMDHYGRSEDLNALLSIWLKAFCRKPEAGCRQELNPFTGEFVMGGGGSYTPSLIIMIQAAKRVLGIE